MSTDAPAGGKPVSMPVYMVKPPAERRGLITDLTAWIAKPGPETAGPAKALLRRCGQLAVKGVVYRLVGDKIESIAGAELGALRQREAASIDTIKYGSGD